MPMEQEEILRLVSLALPDAQVEIEDLRGDGDHYAMRVVSDAFRGLPVVDQHRLVFTALQGRVGGVLRELMLTTLTPEQERGDES